MLIKVFTWIVFPSSILYVCVNFYLFGKNTISSMLWSIAIFIYSQFLPDLPSIYRKKDSTEDLPSYKKYVLLLFAPLLIWLLFSDIRLNWKTIESFHNFQSLAIYVVFLFLCSFLAFGKLPPSASDMTEVLSLPLYGLTGYLTHLKVDKIW
ncbi:MAG: hypothetical protein QXH91_06195 [Candidatus Bathyarchaeia archaeon]